MTLLQVHIRKVKLLKAPKFDLGALLGLHGESGADDSGQKVLFTHWLPLLAEINLFSRLRRSSRSRRRLRAFDGVHR